MDRFDHQKIEKKWQERWGKEKPFRADDASKKEKRYVLDMFPYPSAEGLHVGHPEGYTASDIYSRYLRMKGYEVLHPMGFDAFGLPAENYALKTGTHPSATTQKNIENMRRQIMSLGFSYDWDREVITTDPKYYKWTQWIFVELFKHGLAYEADAPINWCPKDKTGLANEEVINGKCERCGAEVTKKKIKQWLVKITDERYIERLLNDLEKLNWPENVKEMQRHWIGRSEGAEIDFPIHPEQAGMGLLKVFTTRPDTIFGATYMVVAPEHPIVKKALKVVENKKEVEKYVETSIHKSDLDRTDLAKEKTGVEMRGIHVVNPATKKEIPVWVADYVLGSYGTGAIMAVPAHDERDWEFAKKYGLPIKEVVQQAEYRFKTCLIIHGRPSKDHSGEPGFLGEENCHWIPWVKKHLEERGTTVYNPRMPRSWEPDYQEWKKTVEKIDIDEHSVIVGHSAGGAFIVRWLSETKKKIRKLILVSPSKSMNPKKDYVDIIAKFYEFNVDPDLKNRINESVIFTSNDEERHLKSAELYAKELSARTIRLENHGHFISRDMKNNELPELLTEISLSRAFSGEGIAVNSGQFDGLKSSQCITKVIDWLEKEGVGKRSVNYRLRDWLFSRQRYWGEPIPIIHCKNCGHVAVPEKDLPVELPKVKKYQPTGTGQSPLATIAAWVNTTCPKCGGKAKRETNTMPQWAGSNWYFLRYCDPTNSKRLADPKKLEEWLPVNLYIGGAEHAVLHLLYARFIYKFLYDIGAVPEKVGDEPFVKLKNQGLILGEDGQKMSKSRGNVINPDEVIKKYGADTMRMYEMFMGPFEDAKPWSMKGIVGVRRFIDKVWKLSASQQASKPAQAAVPALASVNKRTHALVKKISEDILAFKFNTSIAAYMEYVNAATADAEKFSLADFEVFVKLLSPFAPHIAEELWELMGHRESISKEPWPTFDPKMIVEDRVQLVVQINGKVRDQIMVAIDINQAEATRVAVASEKVQKWLDGKQPKKIIYVKGKLLSIVV